MTREEDYTISDKWWQEHAEKFHVDCLQVEDIVDRAFWAGAEWADTHSHWISVEDELPPKEDDSLDLSVDVLATNGNEVYKTFYDYYLQRWIRVDDFNLDDITHWMPLPSVEHLKKGGKK